MLLGLRLEQLEIMSLENVEMSELYLKIFLNSVISDVILCGT